jgi:hypothetical protein
MYWRFTYGEDDSSCKEFHEGLQLNQHGYDEQALSRLLFAIAKLSGGVMPPKPEGSRHG